MKKGLKGRNIVLIGMPGAGKSTIGVLLAKALSLGFIDTDVCIQLRQGRRLQDILDSEGLERFCGIEEQFILSLECTNTVIATGGSVVYSDKAMKHLKDNGLVVYLDLPIAEIEKRLTNLAYRGVVMEKDATLKQLYQERKPLYEKYADIVVSCNTLSHEEVIAELIKSLF